MRCESCSRRSSTPRRRNEGIRNGKLPELMKETLEHLKPEAAYFDRRGRSADRLLVFDMKDSSQMPPSRAVLH